MTLLTRTRARTPLLAAALAVTGAAAAVGVGAAPASASGGRTLFVQNAVEQAPTAAHPSGTVSLPLHHGTSRGRPVSYIITESSDGSLRGVNESDKLENAAGTAAVQRVTINRDGTYDFPASVDFAPVRRITPGPTGFAPTVAEPGAVGEAGYSPLVQLPNGTIVNAPQIINATGRADKVVSTSADRTRVTYEETAGFSNGNAVRYLSTEASDPVGAALENATYAPALNAAPAVGDDGSDSARAPLAAFTNGRTGVANPQRQGLSSAILDGRDPLNLLARTPNQGGYSPLWDVHLAQWTPSARAAGQDVRQTDFSDLDGLADDGQLTSFGGGAFGPAGFIVNCPIISQA